MIGMSERYILQITTIHPINMTVWNPDTLNRFKIDTLKSILHHRKSEKLGFFKPPKSSKAIAKHLGLTQSQFRFRQIGFVGNDYIYPLKFGKFSSKNLNLKVSSPRSKKSPVPLEVRSSFLADGNHVNSTVPKGHLFQIALHCKWIGHGLPIYIQVKN